MRRLNGERGGIAVIVAILLVVVFGMGALVVDVGQIYWERRQLQTGAEAGALALGAECAEGLISCTTATVPALGGVAEPYANDNAADARSAVPALMAHGTDPGVCEPGGDNAANPLTDVSLVKVSTETIDASNNASFITHVLGPVLGLDTKTVSACAVAMWGYAASLSTFPLVISTCEYDAATTTTYPAPHPNSDGTANQEKIILQAGGGDECSAEAGHDTDGDGSLPAGFGWLVNDGSCEIVTTVVGGDEWVDKDSGANPECSDTEFAALLNTVVQIPVFNDFCRPPHDPAPACPDYSNNDKYRIATYASFYLQGYRFPGINAGDYSMCTASEKCIVGYFTTSTSFDGDIGGPPGGVIVVKLAG